MAEQAWTPGPWSATRPDGSYHDVIRIFADADRPGALPVAVCPQRKSAFMEVVAGSTNETTEAARNAHLIATAPILYEAAMTALGLIQPLTGQGEDHIWRPANKAWEALAEATRKARGEQP